METSNDQDQTGYGVDGASGNATEDILQTELQKESTEGNALPDGLDRAFAETAEANKEAAADGAFDLRSEVQGLVENDFDDYDDDEDDE